MSVDRNGFSLFELIVIVAILVIVLAIAMPLLSKYLKQYRIDNEINTLYSNLVKQRFKSMNSGIPQGIRFDSTLKYTLFEFDDKNYNLKFDGVNEERNRESVTVSYSFNSNVVGKVIMFDSDGIARDENWGIGGLTVYVNFPANHNCVKVHISRIKLGVWNGSNCEIK